MEYVYAALLLHSAKQEVNEANIKKVMEAAGTTTDDAKIKALIASLEGVNIDEAITKAAVPVAAAPASAETEGAEKPELLLDAFLDKFSAVSDITKGKGLLILGSKGSGKSAIGERLRLLAKQNHGLFVTVRHMSSFPYRRFSKIVPGKDEIEIRYPRAWDLLFLITLCCSFARDNAADYSEDFHEIIKTLQKNNLYLWNTQLLK